MVNHGAFLISSRIARVSSTRLFAFFYISKSMSNSRRNPISSRKKKREKRREIATLSYYDASGEWTASPLKNVNGKAIHNFGNAVLMLGTRVSILPHIRKV